MKNRHFYFVEPSKVDKYHITLIDGYVSALLSSSNIANVFDLVVSTCRSTYANLSGEVKRRISHRLIPVVHQDKHQIVRKSLVEFFVVARQLLSMRPNDVVFISCIVPPALILVEWLNRILARRHVFVVIHGEIDGYVEGRCEHWRSIGFWATKWMQLRPRESLINVVVIDDFILDALAARCTGKLDDRKILVVHHPITAMTGVLDTAAEPPAVCFVGFRTRSKGFDVFETVAKRHSDLAFLAIGQGKIQDVRTLNSVPLGGSQNFLASISRCAAAVFPYTDGYTATLSAAAIDTMSAGVHIVATARPFFVSLADYFGPDFVTIYRTEDELDALLADPRWLEERRSGQPRRLAALASSKYGPAALVKDFEALCTSCAAEGKKA